MNMPLVKSLHCHTSVNIYNDGLGSQSIFLFPDNCPVDCGTGLQYSYLIVLQPDVGDCPPTEPCSRSVISYGIQFNELDLDPSNEYRCIANPIACNTQVVLHDHHNLLNIRL